MPELPEVECVRRSLEPRLVGRRIGAVRVFRQDYCMAYDERGRERRVRGEDLLEGARITGVTRRGKHLAVIAEDGRGMALHLGMSGQLLWNAARGAGERDPHVHVRWTVEDDEPGGGGVLAFRDPRRFGGVWAYPTLAALVEARWRELGPDALEISGAELRSRLGGTRRAIKAALLDQGVLAGVGNIYADESLFRARLHPERIAGELGADDTERLARAIREVLRDAVRLGGSTLRDYRDANGDAGEYQGAHEVYGRGGEACRRCGRTLESLRVGQRTTVYCPGCQGR